MAPREHLREAPPQGLALRDLIQRWLSESGLYTSRETQPGMVFMILGRYPAQPPPAGQSLSFYVLQTEQDESAVAVLANVTFANDHRQALNQLPELERNQFFRNLGAHLVFEAGYAFQQEAQTHEYLGVQLAEQIYLDAPLTKHVLMKTIAKIYAGYLFISWKLQELVPATIVHQ